MEEDNKNNLITIQDLNNEVNTLNVENKKINILCNKLNTDINNINKKYIKLEEKDKINLNKISDL